jgi:acetylornithine/N-succinyldiaminopimelate aminotransferase
MIINIKEPGLFNQALSQFEVSSALLNNYSRFEIEFVSGKGAYLYDNSGREYLDFLSGIAVTGFGHNHPHILAAVQNQLNKVWHTSNLFQSELQESLARKLVSHSGLDYVFFCNSGSEANETAIKLVRKWGNGRSAIITAHGGFHGRTMGSLSASAQYKLWDGFFPLTPGFVHVPYNDIEAVENSITSNTAAILIEPIQGESGIILPSEDYLKNLRSLCDSNNLLLIVDEVQSGMGRTGKMFAHQWGVVKPDIITLAKGIANGLPLGAVVCNEKTAKVITPGSHGSTFGGNPVSVSAANIVLDLLTDQQLNYISAIGERLITSIRDIKHPAIREVRGKGLMIGVEFKKANAKKIAYEFLAESVVVGISGDKVIRILPPFIVTNSEIDKFITVFYSILKNLDE